MNPIRRQFFLLVISFQSLAPPNKKHNFCFVNIGKPLNHVSKGPRSHAYVWLSQPPWHGMALRPFNCQLRSYHAKSICAAVQVWLQQVLMPWGRTKFKLGLAQIHNFISQEHLSGRQETGSWENRYEREREISISCKL